MHVLENVRQPVDATAESPSAAIIESFLQGCDELAESDALKELVRRTMEIFLQLHELVNDPNTRENAANDKADLVYELVLQQLGAKDAEDLARRNIKLEKIEAVDPRTGTNTFNVLVTFGDPTTGPTTVLMVHHDTIATPDNDHSLSIDEAGNLVGRTVQDDTIHAAAMLATLSRIEIPITGAVQVDITDHEELGCRGSSAMLDALLSLISANHPVACIALESVGEKPTLAIGHRGKHAASVKSDLLSIESVATAAMDFCRHLREVQEKTYRPSLERPSMLGPTSGTSTYGGVTADGLRAVLDFRTNEVVPPGEVEGCWETSNSISSEEKMIRRGQELLREGTCRIEVDQHGTIRIESISTKRHPSEYNLDQDETIMPVLYVVLRVLEQTNFSSRVQAVTWGEKTKQNSNPVLATVTGNWGQLDTEVLVAAIFDFQASPDTFTSQTELRLEKVTNTDCVVTEPDQRMAELLNYLSAEVGEQVETITVKYMTDIATLVARLKQRQSTVYGLVTGIGEIARLHGVESVSPAEVLRFINMLPKLLNKMQSLLSA